MQTKNEIDILTIKAKIQKLELELNENKHLLKFLLRRWNNMTACKICGCNTNNKDSICDACDTFYTRAGW